MPEAGEIGVGAPTTRDVSRTAEIKDTKETVIDTFNSASSLFESYEEGKLTPRQKAAKELIRDIKGKTLDKGKTSYSNEFEGEDGTKFSQREYLPVDELILFLRERVKSGELTSEDEIEYRKLEGVLHRNSKEYYRGAAKKEFPRKIARIAQEADRISSDPRLTSGNPHDDFLEAGRILFERRELIIPPARETPTSSAEETPPAPTEPEPEPTKREFFIVNRMVDIQRRAREIAREHFMNEIRRGNALNPLNWPRKIGLRIMEEYWSQKIANQVQNTSRNAGNAYSSVNAASRIGFRDLFRRDIRNLQLNTEAHRAREQEAGQTKITQIKTGELYADQEVREAQRELRTAMIEEILRPVVEGTITDPGQIQQLLRDFVANHENDAQVQALFGRNINEHGRLAEYFATDLLEMGQAVRQDLDSHRYALDQLDSMIQIKLANTSWAAESQGRFSAADRAVRWIERHRLTGTLINPATIGAGFSLATYVATRGLGVGLRFSPYVVPGAGIIPGAVFAAVRRSYDLKIDRETNQIERAYNMQIPQGARRREALEQFAYNTASTDELLNGGGQEILTGTDRLSLQELLARDLSEGQTTNREAILRRIAEIKSRLDFSSRERVDLITYQAREQVEQGRLELIRSTVEARQTLRNAGMEDAEIAATENNFLGQWNSRFTQNRGEQDRAFARYRLRNAASAAVFGGTAGLAGGFAIREAMEKTGINPLGFFFHEAGRGIGKFKDLFRHGGTVNISEHTKAVINPSDHSATFVDETGKTVAHGNLGADGVFHNVVAGDGLNRNAAQNFSNQLNQAGFTSQIHETTVTSPSVTSQIQEALTAHKPSFEVHHGSIDLLVQGQSGHVTIHDALANATIHGQVSPDGSMSFSQTGNPNIDLTALHHDLASAGFGVTEVHQTVLGGANPADTLLSQPASELHAKGIVETDMYQKAWNFHVLRPDIVAATGAHTHNELTLHIGQYLDANGKWIQGQKGLINFGGDVKGVSTN